MENVLQQNNILFFTDNLIWINEIAQSNNIIPRGLDKATHSNQYKQHICLSLNSVRLEMVLAINGTKNIIA